MMTFCELELGEILLTQSDVKVEASSGSGRPNPLPRARQ
jgi:hypothetical protein